MNNINIPTILLSFFLAIITSIITSFLSYQLTARAKKRDSLFKLRLKAMKTIIEKLVTMIMQFEFNINERQGNEIGIGESYLDDVGGTKAARVHFMELDAIHLRSSPYITEKANKAITNLRKELQITASMELSTPPGVMDEPAIAKYRSDIKSLRKCIETLKDEITIP